MLRLSWSMSLGSLPPSSLQLCPSKLSSSGGGRGTSGDSILAFFWVFPVSPSLSEESFTLSRLLLFGTESSMRPFLAGGRPFSHLLSLLDVLMAPGDALPRALRSSRGPTLSFFLPLLIDIESLFCRVFIL